MFKDFVGNELNIGDEVIFIQVGYKALAKGKILRLGPKKATITPDNTRYPGDIVIQFYDQIIKWSAIKLLDIELFKI